MKKHRKEIESLKAKLFADITQNTMKYKYAIVKDFQLAYNKWDMSNTTAQKELSNKFEKEYLSKYNLSKNDKGIFVQTLDDTQHKIAEVWNDYYASAPLSNQSSDLLPLASYDRDKMLAAYSVDFEKVEKSIKEKVIREFRASIKGEYGFNTLRKRLINTGLGFNEASSEAQTALAQFDNSYNTQMALEAGIEKFIYDGIDQNSRPFCVKHLRGIYTIAQLRALDNGQGLPVETSLGGYRCTHWLTPHFASAKGIH